MFHYRVVRAKELRFMWKWASRSRRWRDRRSGRGGRLLVVIKNASTRFAVKHFPAFGAPHFLKYMRPDAHSTSGAFLVADFGQRDAVMFFYDAVVMIQHILIDPAGNKGACALQLRKRFFSFRFFSFNLGALAANNFLHFLQRFLRNLDATVVLLARHHLFQQAVFRFGNFFFRHLHFVLQSFVSFVRFNLGSLIFVLPYFFLPSVDVEFVFLAIFDGGKLRGFAVI